jgi:RecB family exonuclease
MESEKADLEKEAVEILKTPGLKHLFEGEIQVENERDILQKNQTASRPDRVVHHNGQVTIIDYKTGIALESHARQLKHYGLLYREMGYPQVNLLLIYFNPTRLVPVNF